MSDNRTHVDSGALTMALNVLRRAGKSEVADALEASANRVATQAGALQAVGDEQLRQACPYESKGDRAAWLAGARHTLAATQPNAAPGDGQGAAAYLMTRPSGTAWPLMPKDVTPEWREACAADGTSIQALYLAAPSTATAAREQEEDAQVAKHERSEWGRELQRRGDPGLEYDPETGDVSLVGLASRPEAPAAPSAEGQALLDRFEKATCTLSRLHTEYMGKAMTDEVYDRFATLRDETLPALRKELLKALRPIASEPQPIAGPSKQ